MNRTDTSSAFYTVADSGYFVGLVALINSVRLVGHHEPIYVTDCGLSESQRRRLADHVTLVKGPAVAPHLAKTVAPLAHAADIMVLIDADMIVTRPLAELLDKAHSGKVVAFTDRIADRFDERWSELLGLGYVRRQPYVNSGLIVAERAIGETALEQVAAGCAQVDMEQTLIANGPSDYPFFYPDQDILNAVLGTFRPEQVEILDHRLAPVPPFLGLRVVDETTLRCTYEDGLEPYVLHHVLEKPWSSLTRWNIYSLLLARLLLEPDVPLTLAPREVPLRLRRGTIAWLEKRRSDGVSSLVGMRDRRRRRRQLAGLGRGRNQPDGAPPPTTEPPDPTSTTTVTDRQ
jgi:hypothetical protein